MKNLIKINLLLFSLLLITKAFAIYPYPVGFERWIKSEHSSIEFGKSCEYLQQRYNHQNFFGNIKFDRNKNYDSDYRLTDIEIRKDHQNHSGGLVYDAVYVANKGDFYRKSWLVCDVDKAWLDTLISNDKVVLLDIERYIDNQKERWSAIIQLPPFNVESRILTNRRVDDINDYAKNGEWRVLDIDAVYVEDPNCSEPDGIFAPDEPQACEGLKTYYNAILVKNEKNNYVDWKLDEYVGDEYLGPGKSPPQVPGAWQLVDREAYWGNNHIAKIDPSEWSSAMIFVKKDNKYATLEKQTLGNVVMFNQPTFRVIDLESYDDPFAHPVILVTKWYTVNANILF